MEGRKLSCYFSTLLATVTSGIETSDALLMLCDVTPEVVFMPLPQKDPVH